MQTHFSEVLESVEELPVEEQEILVDIVRNRLVEQRRVELRAELNASSDEFERGMCKEMTVDEIMAEALK